MSTWVWPKARRRLIALAICPPSLSSNCSISVAMVSASTREWLLSPHVKGRLGPQVRASYAPCNPSNTSLARTYSHLCSFGLNVAFFIGVSSKSSVRPLSPCHDDASPGHVEDDPCRVLSQNCLEHPDGQRCDPYTLM